MFIFYDLKKINESFLSSACPRPTDKDNTTKAKVDYAVSTTTTTN